MKFTKEMLAEAQNDNAPNFDAVEEDLGQDMISTLQSLYSKAKALGDELKSLSDNNIEMKIMIVDLANSAYTLASDIQDAGETYNELSNEAEESVETLDDEDFTLTDEVPSAESEDDLSLEM